MFARLLSLKIVFSLLFLTGCAKNQLVAPSGGAVEGGLSNIESSVSTAEAQRTDIVKENAAARSKLQRVHDKEVLEVRYREYRAKHPRPTPTP